MRFEGACAGTSAFLTVAHAPPFSLAHPPSRQLHVITSKQRPRKLTIHGSDGAEYMFLLKVGVGWGGEPAFLVGGWWEPRLNGTKMTRDRSCCECARQYAAGRRHRACCCSTSGAHPSAWGPSPRPPTRPLQGHEDLRQDERVMQLFGLVGHGPAAAAGSPAS